MPALGRATATTEESAAATVEQAKSLAKDLANSAQNYQPVRFVSDIEKVKVPKPVTQPEIEEVVVKGTDSVQVDPLPVPEQITHAGEPTGRRSRHDYRGSARPACSLDHPARGSEARCSWPWDRLVDRGSGRMGHGYRRGDSRWTGRSRSLPAPQTAARSEAVDAEPVQAEPLVQAMIDPEGRELLAALFAHAPDLQMNLVAGVTLMRSETGVTVPPIGSARNCSCDTPKTYWDGMVMRVVESPRAVPMRMRCDPCSR